MSSLLIPVIPALGRLRQNSPEFKVSLVSRVRLHLQIVNEQMTKAADYIRRLPKEHSGSHRQLEPLTLASRLRRGRARAQNSGLAVYAVGCFGPEPFWGCEIHPGDFI